MQISRIIIKNFQQFDFLDLDLTYPISHPKSGQPLDKICLIGKNGTGKTTILNLLNSVLQQKDLLGFANFVLRFKIEGEEFYIFQNESGPPPRRISFYSSELDKESEWINEFKNSQQRVLESKYAVYRISGEKLIALKNKINDYTHRLLIYSPCEVHTNELLNTSDLPQTNLNNALAYFSKFPYYHNVSFENVKGFWNMIIYQIKKRESDYQLFLHLDRNEDKTISQLEETFNKENPQFLNTLSDIWNKILERAGLFFDVEKAKIPMQLTDNLLAYIKVKNNNANISYSRLSSGIRHYIFRLGYFASLYFNREIKSAVALVDEAENSLFPDLLFDLVEEYNNVTKNTQFFYATHSPIIAAQFESCERVILDFEDNGNVTSRKGIMPIGDDPNDLLIKDFGLRSILGKKGIEKWERFIELRSLIKAEMNRESKKVLLAEFLTIGREYNFPIDEIPE